jgi:hypothetical protein
MAMNPKPYPKFPDSRPGPWIWSVSAKKFIPWRKLFDKETLDKLDREDEDLSKTGDIKC